MPSDDARWALITAGAQGLGGAISRGLLADGYSVVVHYHSSADAAEALAAEAGPRRGLAVQADLSTSEGCRSLLDAVRDGPGRLDVLINNLGVYPEKDLLDFDGDEFRGIFAVTCPPVFELTQGCLPMLREALDAGAQRARVVNIGDSGADRIEARVQATPYHIAKLGVHVLTRTFAKALKHEPITVNMVSPGFLENSVGHPGEPLPADRPGRFEDMLAAIRYLLSPAADYVSGTNVVVSGGWNLG